MNVYYVLAKAISFSFHWNLDALVRGVTRNFVKQMPGIILVKNFSDWGPRN
jgi:hypothetical protein